MLVMSAALAVTAVPPAAHALSVTHIEGMISTVFQSEQSSFSGIGLRAHVQSPLLIPQITFLPVIEYWRNTNKLDAFDIKSSQTDATLGFEARYTFAREGFKPYLGLGWGAHFMSSEVDSPSLALEKSDSVTRGAMTVLGGVTMPITEKLLNVLEVKFHYLPGDNQTKLNYGLSFKL
jgi:uncharacterized protein involved in copper resistance